jgi:uncharacterized protein YndB with AHSA1/START domain
MKWILLTLGSLIAFVAIVAIIGWILPEGHTASRTVRFGKPPDVVWQALTDFRSMPSWRADLERIEQLPNHDGNPVWKEYLKGGFSLPLETIAFDPPHRLVRRIADPKLPFGGTWTYELAPAEGGTKVTITENGFVSNPLFRVMSRFSGQARTIEQFFKALAGKFGEEARFL